MAAITRNLSPQARRGAEKSDLLLATVLIYSEHQPALIAFSSRARLGRFAVQLALAAAIATLAFEKRRACIMSKPQIVAAIEKNRSVLVALDDYQGHHLVDLRVHADYHCTGVRPTRKGISLKVGRLPELITALKAAEAERRGLLGGGAS
jgi:hypothetical protein